MCLGTLQGGGFNYRLWDTLDISSETGKRLTEFADFIHVLLTLDTTKVDYPRLVDLALLGNRHNRVARTVNRMLTRWVFHSSAASTTACALMRSPSCMARASISNLSLIRIRQLASRAAVWIPAYMRSSRRPLR